MKQDSPSAPRFDDYLNKLESLERKRRRKRLLMALPLVVLIAGGVWFTMQSPSDVISGSLTSAAQPAVNAEFIKADNSEWLDIEPGVQTGSSGIEKETIVIEQPVVADKEPIWFTVDISGRRQVRERLVYRIENYRENFTYTIDFGNGVVRPMKESISYKYPLPGHFDMKLTAISPDGEEIEYVKKYEIVPAQSVASQVSQP